MTYCRVTCFARRRYLPKGKRRGIHRLRGQGRKGILELLVQQMMQRRCRKRGIPSSKSTQRNSSNTVHAPIKRSPNPPRVVWIITRALRQCLLSTQTKSCCQTMVDPALIIRKSPSQVASNQQTATSTPSKCPITTGRVLASANMQSTNSNNLQPIRRVTQTTKRQISGAKVESSWQQGERASLSIMLHSSRYPQQPTSYPSKVVTAPSPPLNSNSNTSMEETTQKSHKARITKPFKLTTISSARA
ncbi:hypothetical protein FGO68_gene16586 [Halteria grandinella]|uniref:Uncharacterized protein n=1 Tax=Halteria grandinella TaxID=5974 RepID=A0A8J8SX88_HALGN|nr:hypothetical protein FGO68_gene16586 [Halteria grandinella]